MKSFSFPSYVCMCAVHEYANAYYYMYEYTCVSGDRRPTLAVFLDCTPPYSSVSAVQAPGFTLCPITPGIYLDSGIWTPVLILAFQNFTH